MTLSINQKQLEAVLKTDAPKRYKYFMRLAADQKEVWGLWDDGWALAGDEKGSQIFPLWPAEEYAKLCSIDIWSSYKPEVISIEELKEDLLPRLEQDGILLGIFYTPNNKGVVVDVGEFTKHLDFELSRY